MTEKSIGRERLKRLLGQQAADQLLPSSTETPVLCNELELVTWLLY